MMRRFRSFRRGRRPPMQWVPCLATPAPTTLTTSSTILVSSLAGEASQQPNIARMTVHRVMMDITGVNGDAVRGNVTLGVAQVTLDNTGAVPAMVPRLQSNMDFPWMFLRDYMLEGTAVGGFRGFQFCMPYGGHVDIKSKRVLRPQEAIVLYITNGTGSTLTVGVYARALISRVA